MIDSSISLDRIREAAGTVDPAFLHSPQLVAEPLSRRLGVTTVLKVETVNPIRSFKGRGADYLLQRLGGAHREIVCASAGNFGQGMAYACRKRGVRLVVYVAITANPLKIARMRDLGAKIEIEVGDFDAAKGAARRHAKQTGALYVEDGLLGPISEGAGTIAVELAEGDPLDAVFVPLGNGALVNGVGTWLKHHTKTRVIAVCATGAPAMALSWREGRAIDAPVDTIADGIAVRVPIPEAVAIMKDTVDEVMLVSDHEMREAMKLLLEDEGLVVEPAGAAGVAAIVKTASTFGGKRVATVLTGGNITNEQLLEIVY